MTLYFCTNNLAGDQSRVLGTIWLVHGTGIRDGSFFSNKRKTWTVWCPSWCFLFCFSDLYVSTRLFRSRMLLCKSTLFNCVCLVLFLCLFTNATIRFPFPIRNLNKDKKLLSNSHIFRWLKFTVFIALT